MEAGPRAPVPSLRAAPRRDSWRPLPPGTPAPRGARPTARGWERGPQTSPGWGPEKGGAFGREAAPRDHPSSPPPARVKTDPVPSAGARRAGYQRLAPPVSAERAGARTQAAGRPRGSEAPFGGIRAVSSRGLPAGRGHAGKAPHPLPAGFPPSAALRARVARAPQVGGRPQAGVLQAVTWLCPQGTAHPSGQGCRLEPTSQHLWNVTSPGEVRFAGQEAAFELGL